MLRIEVEQQRIVDRQRRPGMRARAGEGQARRTRRRCARRSHGPSRATRSFSPPDDSDETLQRVSRRSRRCCARTSPHVISPSPLASRPSARSRSRSAMSHCPVDVRAVANEREVGVARLVRERRRGEQRREQEAAMIRFMTHALRGPRRPRHPRGASPRSSRSRSSARPRRRRHSPRRRESAGRPAPSAPSSSRSRERERPARVVADLQSIPSPPRADAACRRAFVPPRTGRQARVDAHRRPPPAPATLSRPARAAAEARRSRVELGQHRHDVARTALVQQEIGVRAEQVGIARIEVRALRENGIGCVGIAAARRDFRGQRQRPDAHARHFARPRHRFQDTRDRRPAASPLRLCAPARHALVTRAVVSRVSRSQSRCAST